jgi:stage III sporulation protein AH
MGKRQLVLAALIVALGAAVYLNWQFAGNNSLLATDAVASQTGRTYGQTDLVGTSSAAKKTASSASSVAVQTDTNADSLAQAKLSRTQARDTAKDLLVKVINDASSSEAAKKEAVDKAAALANNVIKEDNIETLIKAKGFSDCVVFLQNGECNVVVKVKEASQNNAIVIKDIVKGQTGIAYDKIKIVTIT